MRDKSRKKEKKKEKKIEKEISITELIPIIKTKNNNHQNNSN